MARQINLVHYFLLFLQPATFIHSAQTYGNFFKGNYFLDKKHMFSPFFRLIKTALSFEWKNVQKRTARTWQTKRRYLVWKKGKKISRGETINKMNTKTKELKAPENAVSESLLVESELGFHLCFDILVG